MNLDKKTWGRLALLVGGGVLFGWLLNHFDLIGTFFSFLLGILFPFLTGFIIAFILNIPMSAIEKYILRGKGGKAKRPLAFLITMVLVLGVLALVLWLVVPQLWGTIVQLVNSMPGYIRELQKAAEPLGEYLPVIEEWLSDLNIDWRNFTAQIGDWLTSGAGNLFSSVVNVATGIVGGTFSLFIAMVFAIYLLLDKEHLIAQLKGLMFAYIPKERCEKIFSVGRLTNRTFRGFVSGQCIEALIIMVIFSIVLSISGFDYALLISIFTGFCALIPIVGGFIGGAFGALLILMSMGFWRAVIFLIIFIVIQQLEANTVYNYVIGSSVGLPAIWVLVAVMVGGGLAGIFGMLFFIPLFSVLYTLLHRNARARLEKKGLVSPVRELPEKGKRRRKRKHRSITDEAVAQVEAAALQDDSVDIFASPVAAPKHASQDGGVADGQGGYKPDVPEYRGGAKRDSDNTGGDA